MIIMYTIYADDVCIYNDVSSLDNMKISEPKLILEDCAAGSLSMTLPKSNVGYDFIERLTTDIIVKKDGNDIWKGRVLTESKDFWNNRVLYCEGELAFLNDSTQPQAKYSSYSIRDYIDELLTIHNSKVSENRQISLGIVTVNDDSFPDFYSNYDKTFSLINALVDRYGGHLRIRRENGIGYLDYLKECPNTCTQLIQFGSNLLDFTRSWDETEFATVLVPLGARLNESAISELDSYVTVEEVNDGSIYVQSLEAVEHYGWIEKTATWDNVDDPEELLVNAEEYLTDLQFDNMQIELSALDLHYWHIDYEAVNLLDELQVISPPHGLNRLFPVSRLEIPLDNPEKTQFKLGDTVKTSLTSVNNQLNAAILEKIEGLPKAHNILQEAKDNATAIMNLATTGFITITKDQNGSETLYISNTRDYTDATKLWKWNMNGLGYSNDGGETYGLAITMDGAIVADYITAGVLNGDVIRAGVIKDYGGNVEFDLDDGKLTMKSGSIYLGAYDDESEHYMFEVDENGNVYAGSGIFAGTLAAANGTFGGIVQAEDFLDQYGRSMMSGDQFKSDYLSLYGIEITDRYGNVTFKVTSRGDVTISGNIIMGAGSSIDWATVDEENIEDSLAYQLASENILPDYIQSTHIDSAQIISPDIFWGEYDTIGSLTQTTGSDGVYDTEIIQISSNKGIVIDAMEGMRFEASGIWMHLDYSDIHVLYNNRYVDLGTLIATLS